MPTNAIELLDADHQRVEALFRDFESGRGDAAARHDIAQIICMELQVHTQLEEEIFYPAFRECVGDEELLKDAQEEHDKAKKLIQKIQSSGADESTMTELRREVEHHVKDEREKMFPKARKASGMDLEALGRQLEARKNELVSAHAS